MLFVLSVFVVARIPSVRIALETSSKTPSFPMCNALRLQFHVFGNTRKGIKAPETNIRHTYPLQVIHPRNYPPTTAAFASASNAQSTATKTSDRQSLPSTIICISGWTHRSDLQLKPCLTWYREAIDFFYVYRFPLTNTVAIHFDFSNGCTVSGGDQPWTDLTLLRLISLVG